MKHLLSAALLLSTFAAHAALTPEQVVAQAKAQFSDCEMEDRTAESRVSTVTIKEEYVTNTYHVVLCSMAAYNDSSVVFYEGYAAEGQTPQLMQIHLTEPVLGPRYGIKGYKSTSNAMGAGVDEKGILTTFAKGRGIGDSHYAGTYKLEGGEATLIKYSADITMDMRMNPKTIINIKQ